MQQSGEDMESPQDKNVQSMGSNLARLHTDMETLVEQKWQADANIFRYEFDRFVDEVPADKRMRWVYYEQSFRVDETDDVHTREIVLVRIARTGADEREEHEPNLLKIVTNETIEVKGVTQCLSEEILIDYDNDAWYYVDAKMLKGNKPEDMLVLDSAQIFVVQGDDNIGFLGSQVMPKTIVIHDPESEYASAIPMGMYNARHDGEYVLKKAWEILETLRQEYPRYSGTV